MVKTVSNVVNNHRFVSQETREIRASWRLTVRESAAG